MQDPRVKEPVEPQNPAVDPDDAQIIEEPEGDPPFDDEDEDTANVSE